MLTAIAVAHSPQHHAKHFLYEAAPWPYIADNFASSCRGPQRTDFRNTMIFDQRLVLANALLFEPPRLLVWSNQWRLHTSAEGFLDYKCIKQTTTTYLVQI